jgi:biotin carboxylase
VSERGVKNRGTPRVMLLISPQSYRNQAFLRAADRIGINVVQAIDVPEALAREWGVELGVEFSKPDVAVDRLLSLVESRPVDAVLSLDDSATLIASRVSHALGLPHNSPDAALAARDKWIMRQRLHAHGAPAPHAAWFALDATAETLRRHDRFPSVVKPNLLSGSRGVIRADNHQELETAFARTRQILVGDGFTPASAGILIEDYLPGIEVALEGLLTDGRLQVLALFDKPDPLVGPFF